MIVVVNRDPLGKRLTVQCDACGHAFVIGADAVAHTHCTACELPTQERLEALRSEQRDLDLQRAVREWRPG